MKSFKNLIGAKVLNKRQQQIINGGYITGSGNCDDYSAIPLCKPRDTDNSDNANQ
ncbi:MULTISPECIES: hypothetical protein [Aquimarina]|uniref:hypothetical protein n=1 Tax=Aquimarina TaxID=290174 RepID=UPI00131EDF6E|nr:MULTISPECIES: hypothetical protein [Aquimarina]